MRLASILFLINIYVFCSDHSPVCLLEKTRSSDSLIYKNEQKRSLNSGPKTLRFLGIVEFLPRLGNHQHRIATFFILVKSIFKNRHLTRATAYITPQIRKIIIAHNLRAKDTNTNHLLDIWCRTKNLSLAGCEHGTKVSTLPSREQKVKLQPYSL